MNNSALLLGRRSNYKYEFLVGNPNGAFSIDASFYGFNYKADFDFTLHFGNSNPVWSYQLPMQGKNYKGRKYLIKLSYESTGFLYFVEVIIYEPLEAWSSQKKLGYLDDNLKSKIAPYCPQKLIAYWNGFPNSEPNYIKWWEGHLYSTNPEVINDVFDYDKDEYKDKPHIRGIRESFGEMVNDKPLWIVYSYFDYTWDEAKQMRIKGTIYYE